MFRPISVRAPLLARPPFLDIPLDSREEEEESWKGHRLFSREEEHRKEGFFVRFAHEQDDSGSLASGRKDIAQDSLEGGKRKEPGDESFRGASFIIRVRVVIEGPNVEGSRG